VYLLGMLALAALILIFLSGIVLIIGGPQWWHVSAAGHFFNSLASLELARIGSQLFAIDSAKSDQMAAPRQYDTFTTRLSAQPLSQPETLGNIS
jgi:hypothetical protein